LIIHQARVADAPLFSAKGSFQISLRLDELSMMGFGEIGAWCLQFWLAQLMSDSYFPPETKHPHPHR